MAAATIQIEVRFAWWLRPYLRLLAFFTAITPSAEADPQKVSALVARHTFIRAGGGWKRLRDL